MGVRHSTIPRDIMSVATDRRIIELLVRIRMSLRRQRRDNSFYHRLAVTGRNPRAALEKELNGLFPPRSEWPTPGVRARRSAQERGRDAVAHALTNWLVSIWSTPRTTSPTWLRRLRRFVGNIRKRLAEWRPDSTLTPPEVYALLKKQSTEPGKSDTFRCVTVYPLEERILISLVARYFRQTTDSLMHPGSLAFRTQVPPLTHHDAVERLLEFRREMTSRPGARLWVAEVDIRGFFDVVSHDVARQAVSALMGRLPRELAVDERAFWILEAYLQSYSFNGYGRAQALERARRQERAGHAVEVPWPEDQLRALGQDTERMPIGIPQGGALSCFLANAVLDAADARFKQRFDLPGLPSMPSICVTSTTSFASQRRFRNAK